jgi:hypothetical protein
LIYIQRITKCLHSADVLFIGFNLILSCINVVFASRIPSWRLIILSNFAGSLFICVLAYFRHATGWKALRLIHDWYVPVATLVTFKALYFMIKPIHGGRDYDDLLASIDRWLFGVNPTEWIMRFATPWMTEILQIAYTLFYFLFLLLGYEFYRRHNLDLFHFFMFTCVYGFFLSYLGYFLLPAVGPRFTLHEFATLELELPGVLLTPYLRDWTFATRCVSQWSHDDDDGDDVFERPIQRTITLFHLRCRRIINHRHGISTLPLRDRFDCGRTLRIAVHRNVIDAVSPSQSKISDNGEQVRTERGVTFRCDSLFPILHIENVFSNTLNAAHCWFHEAHP